MAKKKILLTILAIIILLMATCLVMSFSMQRTVNNTNTPTYPSYYTEALKNEKPVFLFFYANWCTHCVDFMPTYNELEKTYKDKYNFIKVNVDNKENISLIEDFYVMGIPAVFIVEPKTEKRYSINNYILHDKNALAKEMDKFLKR